MPFEDRSGSWDVRYYQDTAIQRVLEAVGEGRQRILLTLATVVEGEVEEGRRYVEADFNPSIEIKEREEARVNILMSRIDQREKTLVFCRYQPHAAFIRDLINQKAANKDPLYCCRVTANDGALGDQYLREFQDNEKTIPTILTTSQKLSPPNSRRPLPGISRQESALTRTTKPLAAARGFAVSGGAAESAFGIAPAPNKHIWGHIWGHISRWNSLYHYIYKRHTPIMW